jgi:hypothetical protein
MLHSQTVMEPDGPGGPDVNRCSCCSARLRSCWRASDLRRARAITRSLTALLVGVSPHDPGTFAVIGLLLVAIAFVANYLPGRAGRPAASVLRATASLAEAKRRREGRPLRVI